MIKPVLQLPDHVLATPCEPVGELDDRARAVAQDLLDTMRGESHSVGVAAPQIGVGQRVFTWRVDGETGYLINPSLDLSEALQDGPEGCLSIPGLTIDCTRALHVVAHGFDMYGEPKVVEGSELLARALQHETDHLDGILFIDRLDRDARREAMRIVRRRSASECSDVRLKKNGTAPTGLISASSEINDLRRSIASRRTHSRHAGPSVQPFFRDCPSSTESAPPPARRAPRPCAAHGRTP